MAFTYKIYFLYENSNRIRYIGMTKNSLELRLKNHFKESKKGGNYKCRWIRKCLKTDTPINIGLLQSFYSLLDCLEAEKYWIKYFRNLECALVNSCEGGLGLVQPSDETRHKMRASHIGQKPWNKGIPMKPELKEQIRLKKTGTSVPSKFKRVQDSNGTIYKSINAAAEINKINRKCISNVLNGWSKTAGGLTFTYYENIV